MAVGRSERLLGATRRTGPPGAATLARFRAERDAVQYGEDNQRAPRTAVPSGDEHRAGSNDQTRAECGAEGADAELLARREVPPEHPERDEPRQAEHDHENRNEYAHGKGWAPVLPYAGSRSPVSRSDGADRHRLFEAFMDLIEALGWRVSPVCQIQARDYDRRTSPTAPYGRVRKRAETAEVGVEM